MKLSDFSALKWYADDLQSRSRDFYRCYGCGRIFSREHEVATMERLSKLGDMDDDNVEICPCGSRRYTPSMPVFFDWLKPSILRYTVKLILARGVAPLAERYAPRLLPYLDRLSRPSWFGSVSYNEEG